MAIKSANLKMSIDAALSRIKSVFIRKSAVSEKKEVNTRSVKVLAVSFLFIFIATVMLMPNDPPIEFTEKLVQTEQNTTKGNSSEHDDINSSVSARTLWGSPRMNFPREAGSGAEPNYNTSMVLSSGGNAKTQLRAGLRLPLRILDKFIVSQEPVPVLAELILDSMTDSGLRLPAGTRFYGQASFQKGSDRADLRFQQISLPNGQIKPISALALGKDGQPGIVGRVRSDGVKNTTGQLITTFIGGLAAGSVETDILGRSKGGVENGLLSAVAVTAKNSAQNYGEKLKTEREWIEVSANTECDATLSESLNLQQGNEP